MENRIFHVLAGRTFISYLFMGRKGIIIVVHSNIVKKKFSIGKYWHILMYFLFQPLLLGVCNWTRVD